MGRKAQLSRAGTHGCGSDFFSGTWRRVVDDANYPDIAQDAGIITLTPEKPAAQVSSVVHASASEDQALCWSPNGKWLQSSAGRY